MMMCPHCFSKDLRKSRRGNAGAIRLVRFLVVCLRCRACGRKHYRLALTFGALRPSLLVWAPRDS